MGLYYLECDSTVSFLIFKPIRTRNNINHRIDTSHTRSQTGEHKSESSACSNIRQIEYKQRGRARIDRESRSRTGIYYRLQHISKIQFSDTICRQINTNLIYNCYQCTRCIDCEIVVIEYLWVYSTGCVLLGCCYIYTYLY